jgi:hypothetical protein
MRVWQSSASVWLGGGQYGQFVNALVSGLGGHSNKLQIIPVSSRSIPPLAAVADSGFKPRTVVLCNRSLRFCGFILDPLQLDVCGRRCQKTALRRASVTTNKDSWLALALPTENDRP